jgi:methionyl aminopeptidase
MIHIKSAEEIKIMQHGGHILAEVLYAVLDHVKPGVSELELDQLAEKLIREKGGEPGFMKVQGYHHTICASTNNNVVHGIPTENVLKDGDIIGIDCGVYYKGFHTDMAETVIVGSVPDAVETFLATGKQAMMEGIQQAVIGNRVGHISKAIQDIVEGKGYSIVHSLIGHGVGRELHEEPEVPGYVAQKLEKTPLLKEGMTIAVEVIYNMGDRKVELDDADGWTIKTADGSLSGVFERSIVITKDGPKLLTK